MHVHQALGIRIPMLLYQVVTSQIPGYFFHHCPSLSRQRFLYCDRIPLSDAHLCCARPRPVAYAWPSLSRAHGLLYHDTTRHHTVVCASFPTPSLVLCSRAFCRVQLCREIKILCRNRNSPYPGQLYRDIELICHDIIFSYLGQLYRDIKILSHDRKSSQPSQLCRNIELLYCNIKPLHLATLCRDIKYSIATEKS